MAKIFMSMSGEGLGHACRAHALIERLRARHEVTVFAPAAAYGLLAQVGERHGIEVRSIPGIVNAYKLDHTLDAVGTALDLRHYLAQFPWLVDHLTQRLSADKPDLIVTDFEPALPRAARRASVPWLSIDHQHFTVACDLSNLPPRLRWHGFWIGLVVRGMCPPPPHTVVSSFYRLPLKSRYRDVEQVGVLLRPGMRELVPSTGEHVLAYFRRKVPAHVLFALERCGVPVYVYGMGARKRRRNLTFCAKDSDEFAERLASCRALITTAGNQLIGEAMYLRKPVLAMPERGNAEQCLNAYFVCRSGGGTAIEMDRCGAGHVRGFLHELPRFVPDEHARDSSGTARAVAAIERQLSGEPFGPRASERAA